VSDERGDYLEGLADYPVLELPSTPLLLVDYDALRSLVPKEIIDDLRAAGQAMMLGLGGRRLYVSSIEATNVIPTGVFVAEDGRRALEQSADELHLDARAVE
jgi:hypothetical protein